MMIRKINHLAICIGLSSLILMSCSAQSNISSYKILGSSRGNHLEMSTYQYAGGGRDLKTTIIGSPFDIPKPDFDDQITQIMKGNDRGINANFTTTPGDSARAGYHVVMIFNPPSDLSLNRLCDMPEQEKPINNTKSLKVVMVFCAPTPVTAAVGSVKSISSIIDLNFTQMIRNVVSYVTPVDAPISYY